MRLGLENHDLYRSGLGFSLTFTFFCHHSCVCVCARGWDVIPTCTFGLTCAFGHVCIFWLVNTRGGSACVKLIVMSFGRLCIPSMDACLCVIFGVGKKKKKSIKNLFLWRLAARLSLLLLERAALLHRGGKREQKCSTKLCLGLGKVDWNLYYGIHFSPSGYISW